MQSRPNSVLITREHGGALRYLEKVKRRILGESRRGNLQFRGLIGVRERREDLRVHVLVVAEVYLDVVDHAGDDLLAEGDDVKGGSGRGGSGLDAVLEAADNLNQALGNFSLGFSVSAGHHVSKEKVREGLVK